MRRGIGNRKRNAADDAGEAKRQERRDVAWRLRVTERLTVRQIAAKLGVNHQTVQNDLEQAREEHKPPDLEELSVFVRTELERAVKGLRKAVDKGNPSAVQAHVKALDAFCKLHGLYAPEKHEVAASVNEPTPAQARAAITEVFKKNVEPFGDAPDASSAPKEPPES